VLGLRCVGWHNIGDLKAKTKFWAENVAMQNFNERCRAVFMKNLKKRIRLKSFDYKGHYRYFVTICTDKIVGQGFSLASKTIIDKITEMLRQASEKFGFSVVVYCFMPDHLHLLVEGNNEFADLKKFIVMFKQKTGYYYSSIFKKRLWQINYYERVLRTNETTKDVMRYILENPVRKGLVENFTQYPFSGSFVFDIKDQQP